jgi:hypothetical protein
VSQKDLFARLGAPLANARWSWGSSRLADGAVFLRVWQDRVRRYDDKLYVQVTNNKRFRDDPGNLGYQERLNHIKSIKQGARCFMVMCQAIEPHAVPREVKDFNRTEVFPGGELLERDGDFWIELLPRVSVAEAAQVVAAE